MSRQANLFATPRPTTSAYTPPRDRVLTVSALTAGIRLLLEGQFGELWVEGEVSNVRVPGSGHVYFTLKDPASQIRAVLFRAAAQKLRFALREGQQLVVRAKLSVYEPRGEYQLIVEQAEPKGIGALQLAFEQLKERLSAEGLFDPAKKRPLPFLPRRIGIVTSLSGAAIRDMLAVLRRRCPFAQVVIAPAPVQGDQAAPLIADAIQLIADPSLIEVLIVGRGGGSMEDLWCFNDERVVRAIAASPVPVVSAVGHEVDVTLSDFAADLRAPTPSVAAEAVVPVQEELVQRLEELAMRVMGSMRTHVRRGRQHCALLQSRLQQQRFPIYRQAQRLDELWTRLSATVPEQLVMSRHRIQLAAQEVLLHSPKNAVRGACLLVTQRDARLRASVQGLLAGKRQDIAARLGALDGLSPLATLSRGYSILQTDPGGKVVRRAQDVRVGQRLKATVAVGTLVCRVEAAIPEPPSS